MTPRRLLPFLAVFLVLAAAFFLLEWHQVRVAREREEAQKLFRLQQADITAITIKRSSGEIRLVKEGQDWRLVQPLNEEADRVTLNSLTSALAGLQQTRDLGTAQDLKPFGLEQPALVLSFTAGDKSHTLTVGQKIPGGEGYYVRRDQDPGVLVIPASSKESLDRPLSDLRNRSLFDFAVDQVKALRVKTPKSLIILEKKDGNWRWVGRENFDVYPERLERLLRFVSLARVREFVDDAPQNLNKYGLAPPELEITVVADKGEQRLFLGSRKKEDCYARRGGQGPVFLMENLILDLFTAPLESVATLQKNPLWAEVRGSFPQYLEDRRLWTGEVKNVAAFTWGPPEKTWTAARDKDFFKITGPDNQEVRQPAVRVELALLKLRDLEVESLSTSGASEAKPKNTFVLRDKTGQTIFRLEELGEAQGLIKVRYAADNQAPRESLVSRKAYEQWQQGLAQLASPPPAPKEGQEERKKIDKAANGN